MLPKAQKKILLVWLDLLKKFQKIISEEKLDLTCVKAQWQEIENYLKSHIISIDCHDLPLEKKSAWQTWQTETYRYVRLLNTELLFFYSAKQSKIKDSRLAQIHHKLEQMIQLTHHLMG